MLGKALDSGLYMATAAEAACLAITPGLACAQPPPISSYEPMTYVLALRLWSVADRLRPGAIWLGFLSRLRSTWGKFHSFQRLVALTLWVEAVMAALMYSGIH